MKEETVFSAILIQIQHKKNTNKQPLRQFTIAVCVYIVFIHGNDNNGGSLLLPVYLWVYYCFIEAKNMKEVAWSLLLLHILVFINALTWENLEVETNILQLSIEAKIFWRSMEVVER